MELRLGFMASGRGSNVEAILNSIDNGNLIAEAKFVISNNPDAGVLDIVRKRDIPNYCLNSKNTKCLDHEILEVFKKYNVNLGVLAGYNKQINSTLLEYCPFLNVHPAIDLEKYGGKGMYGMNVHRAIINNGERFSGATVHKVTLKYDEGIILGQDRVLVLFDDTIQSLSSKILEVEHKLYTQVLIDIQSGLINLE